MKFIKPLLLFFYINTLTFAQTANPNFTGVLTLYDNSSEGTSNVFKVGNIIPTTTSYYYMQPGKNYFLWDKTRGFIYNNIIAYYQSEVISHATVGTNSISNGWLSTAKGDYSLASGFYATAMTPGSLSVGYSTTAGIGANNYAVALGNDTTAHGASSFAVGAGATVQSTGTSAVSMGNNTIASGLYSAAIGNLSKASATASSALGFGTESKHNSATVVGQFNNNGTLPSSASDAARPLFVVGNGSSVSALSNAFIVKANGDVVIPKAQGDISMGEFQ